MARRCIGEMWHGERRREVRRSGPMVGKSDSLCICRCRVHIGYDDVVDDNVVMLLQFVAATSCCSLLIALFVVVV